MLKDSLSSDIVVIGMGNRIVSGRILRDPGYAGTLGKGKIRYPLVEIALRGSFNPQSILSEVYSIQIILKDLSF